LNDRFAGALFASSSSLALTFTLARREKKARKTASADYTPPLLSLSLVVSSFSYSFSSGSERLMVKNGRLSVNFL